MDVFLVGAGFSRAISEEMRLVGDLVGPLADHLEADGATAKYAQLLRRQSDLEAVLTYLADHQPWLDERDNLFGRRGFLSAAAFKRRKFM